MDGVGIILVFVPFLNKDDGVLLSALQSWAGVEKEEAEVILKEYVEYIRKSLNERGQYIIEGVGVLKYDANRVIYLAKESEAVQEEPVKTEPRPEKPNVAEEKAVVPELTGEATSVPAEQPRVLRQNIPPFPVSLLSGSAPASSAPEAFRPAAPLSDASAPCGYSPYRRNKPPAPRR